MKYFNLPKLCTGIALLLLASILMTLSARSIWLDEAMLLKNIVDVKTLGQFITPLPYYDQAEPVIASFFFRAVMGIFHYDIKPLRLSVMAVALLMILPVFLLFRQYKWGMFVFLVAFIGSSFSTGFHITELKYYFLEVGGSFLAILAIWEAEERKNIFWAIFLAAVISIIGFSTLLIAGGLMGYAFITLVLQRHDPHLRKTKIAAFLCSGLFIAVSYLYMKYLTVYQMNNYVEYVGGTAIDSLKVLANVILGAYGKALLIVSFASSVALLVFDRRGFVFKLNLFFCAMACIVVLGKVAGFYPAAYPRHIIWLLPFSLVISSFAILEFTSSPRKVFKVLGWTLFVILALQAGKAVYKNFEGDNYQYADNNHLYEYVADMAPGTILLYPDAQPSLEYYTLLDERLNKHHYIGVVDEDTKPRDPAMGKINYEKSIGTLFEHRPAGEFYFLISHIDRDTDTTGSAVVFEREMKKYDCAFTSVFRSFNAELLRMNCQGGS